MFPVSIYLLAKRGCKRQFAKPDRQLDSNSMFLWAVKLFGGWYSSGCGDKRTTWCQYGQLGRLVIENNQNNWLQGKCSMNYVPRWLDIIMIS